MTIPDMMEEIRDAIKSLWNMTGRKTRIAFVLVIILILLAI